MLLSKLKTKADMVGCAEGLEWEVEELGAGFDGLAGELIFMGTNLKNTVSDLYNTLQTFI